MREIHYSVAASLDGFIAGPKGEYDWIVMDPDIDFAEIFARFDTLLMGRKSYALTAAGGPGLPRKQIVVVSRTLDPRKHPSVTVIADNLETEIQALKAQPGKDIWLWGGGELFRSLAALGLVDRVEVGVIPVLLGGGIPLFPPPAASLRLSLADYRHYPKSGIMMLSYRIERATAAKGRPPRTRKRR
jgi:dihydrofolate reductase